MKVYQDLKYILLIDYEGVSIFDSKDYCFVKKVGMMQEKWNRPIGYFNNHILFYDRRKKSLMYSFLLKIL